MHKYAHMILSHNMHIADMEAMAAHTLKVLLSGKEINKGIVEYIVKIFYRTDKGVFEKLRNRDRHLVELRKLYMFIRYLYFDTNIQEVADEFSYTRQVIYHHCQHVLDEYDTDVQFRDRIEVLFLPETIEIMRKKLRKKRRVAKWKNH